MKPRFVLYDDAVARAAEPFALTRPFAETRAGAMLIRERWRHTLEGGAAGFIGTPHLASFTEFGSPRAWTGPLQAGMIVVNARFAPRIDQPPLRLGRGEAARAGGRVAAVCLPRDLPIHALAAGTASLDEFAGEESQEIGGWWMDAAWDAVRFLPDMLVSDAAELADGIVALNHTPAEVLGPHRFVVERGAFVEPHVVIDTTAGDVVVRDGARVGAFARIAGPAVIGAHSHVAGGRYSCITTGENTRICGEMSVVIVSGHANKGHDGFVGHSVIGRWANLGAGTITSNLKNSYGSVRVRNSRGEHETGMQFLGSLIGDHAKLAIGTRLMTGTIVGAGANVFGDRSPDKFVPPFAWGDREPFDRYDMEKFLEVATHVMKRRDVYMTPELRQALAGAWQHAAPPRRASANGKPGDGKASPVKKVARKAKRR